MKTIAILALLLLAMTPMGRADDVTAFDYTGSYATNYGLNLSDPVYYSAPSPLSIGGNNDFGYASQFTLNQTTNISALDINAVVLGSDSPTPGNPTTFVYQLYSGSTFNFMGSTNPNEPLPDLHSLIATSGQVTFADTSATYNNVNVPLNTTLQPGTYWLAETGSGTPIVDTTQGYIDPPGGMPTAAAPEQPTWVLMGVGMALLFLFKFRLKII